MKFLLIGFCLIAAISCNEGSFKKAEDAEDAGRQFIRASLDGDYEKARFYLLNDSTNLYLINKFQQSFDQMDRDVRQQYREASILAINIHPINDSITSFTFSNSFRKDTSTVRIVKVKGEWLVDLKEILNDKRKYSTDSGALRYAP